MSKSKSSDKKLTTQEKNFASARKTAEKNHKVDLAHRSIGKTDEPEGVKNHEPVKTADETPKED